jgi:hypothetical protein
MLNGLRRLFSRPPAAQHDWDALVVWSEQQRYVFKPVKDEGGFIIEGQLGTMPWRIEWGPPQRSYVQGFELRIRAETGLGSDVQAMVLDRNLQSTMERAVFEQYVEGVQTQIDNTTPPEMRWLVMLTKLAGSELGPLRDRFAAVGASKGWMMQWLEGGFSEALLAAPVPPSQPLVLLIARGRLTLRTALDEPTPESLGTMLRLFHSALREARRVGDPQSPSEMPSTQPSLFNGAEPPPGAGG